MVFNNGLLLGAAGAQGGVTPFDPNAIGNSVWFDGSSDFLERTPSGAGSTTRWIVSVWCQRNTLGTDTGSAETIFSAGTSGNELWFQFGTTDQLEFGIAAPGDVGKKYSTAVFRDVGWYHVCVSFDSASTVGPSNRIRLFVNGSEITDLSSSTDTPSGQTTPVNATLVQRIADYAVGGGGPANMYMSQFTLLDNQSFQNGDLSITDLLDSFTYGTNGSQFAPKADTDMAALASAAGTNSVCLDFSNSSSLGSDSSTKGNNYTPTSMTSANQTEHTPSLSYPVFNVLCPKFTDGGTWTVGNTKIVSTSEQTDAIGTLPPVSTGKYYYQWVFTDNATSGNCKVGMTPIDNWDGETFSTTSSGDIFYADHRNALFRKGSTTVTSILGSSGTYALAFDLDAGKVWVGSVDTSDGSIDWFNSSGGTDGDPANGTNPTATFTANTVMIPFAQVGKASGTSWTIEWNFGQFGFGNSDVPTGFKKLNSKNLTAPDFQGIDYFDATLYEGNGASQRVGDFVPFEDSETVANSIIFNDNDSAFLNRTYGTPTAATTFTFACWFKLGSATGDQYLISTGTDNASEGYIALNFSTGAGQIWIADPNDGAGFGARGSAVFTDRSQWYHLCVGVDTTAGSGSRVKLEVNGVERTLVTLFGTPTEPSASQSMNLNEGNAFNIGRRLRTSSDLFDGYLANVFFIDGQKKAASDFGQLDTSTNRWVAKAYTGTFGDNGYKLAFGTAPGTGSGAGTDTSGEGNNWTENNFSAADQTTDTPSKNFAVLDPNRNQTNNLSEGNLKIGPGDASWDSTQATLGGLISGKYYLEFTPETANSNIQLTLSGTTVDSTASTLPRGVTDYGYYFVDGEIYHNDASLGSYGAAVGAGVVVGMAIDLDEGLLYFSRDGTFENSGNPATGANPGARIVKGIPYNIVVSMTSSVTTANNTINFGSGTSGFASTPPTDFQAINQDNLDDTVSKLTAFAWIKNRDATDNHMLFDRVRGVGNDLHTNDTAIEVFNANTVQRFLQRGVLIGNDAEVNTANESYVLWQWLLGESATTGSTNESGSINSTVIAADAGNFSVVKYTGNTSSAQTVGHGLGGIAEAIVVKNLAATSTNWPMLHKDLGSIAGGGGNYILLNDAGVTGANTNYWNDTSPTASVFSIGSGGTPDTNDGGGETFIAYCFRSISGVCKVGSYTGTGSATAGPYVPLGFKPRWIMLKNASVGRDWVIVDTARTPINTAEKFLFPNLNIAEAARGSASGSDYDIDILSDAFRPLTGDSAPNGDGNTIIYIAMADIGGNGTLPPIYGR